MKVKEQLWAEEDNDMALCPPVSTNYEGLSEGPHMAICDMVIDLGMQDGTFGVKPQVYIRFEVPGERVEYTDEHGAAREGPKVIGKRYGLSLNEKATLRKDLESWRGRAFQEAELVNAQGEAIFDITKLLGKPCQLGIIKNEKGTSKIATIMGPPKGMPIPVPEHGLIIYDADNLGTLPMLPKWLRETIGNAESTTSDSYEAAHATPPATHYPGPSPVADYDDDIPF